MIERTPILDFICHAILIAGAALICLPIYFAFVASTLTITEVQQVPRRRRRGPRSDSSSAT